MVLIGPSLISDKPDAYSIAFTTMPDGTGAVFDWLTETVKRYEDEGCTVQIGLEKVGGFMGGEKGEGGYGNKASAHTMFQFGRGYGQLEMALTAMGMFWEDVLPKVWQKGVGVTRLKTEKGDAGKKAFKKRLLKKAEDLYVTTKFSLATADAALIAHYLKTRAES